MENSLVKWRSKSLQRSSENSPLQTATPRILLAASENGSVQSMSRRHVIINSYMSSGSSFLGKLLGFRPDTFYWFELFWNYGEWKFVNGSSYVCDPRTCGRCRKSHRLPTVPRVLDDFFGCNFDNLTSLLAGFTPRRSGPLWNCSECKTGTSYRTKCLNTAQKHCTSKTHLVTKVLRSSLGNYGQVLDQDPNAILLQLFRDPRAIVNSRFYKSWYKGYYKSNGFFTENVKCLCSRMIRDHNYGVEFQNKYQGRVIFVVYEDLLSDLPHKLDLLYKRIGMSAIDNIYTSASDEFRKLLSLYGNSTSASQTAGGRKDYAFWWRSSLTWWQVQEIDGYCRDIYDAIGFKAFKDSLTFKNTQTPSVEVREHLRL